MTQVVEPTIDVSDRPVMDWDETGSRRRRNRRKRPAATLHIDRAVEGPDAVVRALEQVRRYCADARDEKQRSAATWRRWSRGLLLPATALAGAAGVGGLALDGVQTPVALAALVAATLGAIAASLAPDRKAEARRVEALRFGVVERNLAVLLYVDRDALTRDRTRVVLERVLGQLDELHGLPATPSFLSGGANEPAPAPTPAPAPPTRRNGFRGLDDSDVAASHPAHEVRV